MPQPKIDGVDRLLALVKLVEWPVAFSGCRSDLVHVTKVGKSYNVRVKIAGRQTYFGTLPDGVNAARLADLVVFYFQKYNGGGKIESSKFNLSYAQAERDSEKSDLKDLMERWEVLLLRENLIGTEDVTGPEVIRLDQPETDSLRILVRDLETRVLSLEDQITQLQTAKAPALEHAKPLPAQIGTVSILPGTFTGPTVPGLFNRKP